MKRLVLTITMMLAFAPVLLAQNNDDKQKISDVKRSENLYLYSDCTRSTEEAALKDAQSQLFRKIETYAQEQGTPKVDDKFKETISDSVYTITAPRGDDKFRAFLYVTRSSINQAFHRSGATNQGVVPQRQPSTTGYPTAANRPSNQPSNQPANSPSISQSVAANQPAQQPTQQPAANRPAQQPAQQPVANRPAQQPAQQPAANPQQPAQQPAVNRPAQQPAANRPAQQPAQQPVASRPAQQPVAQPVQQVSDDDISDAPLSDSEDVLSVMRQTKRISTLRANLEVWKASGAISHYGKINTISNVDDYYLVLYTRNGDIRAILSPATPDRTNILTGAPDQMSNYTGCSIECIKL